MDKIKVTNELLKFVFGCDSYFYKLDKSDLVLSIDCDDKKFIEKMVCEYGAFMDDEEFWHINIHQFIHLAKIKAFECGYDIKHSAKSLVVYIMYNKPMDLWVSEAGFDIKKPFYPHDIIDALEWVTEKVGGDNEKNVSQL